MLGSGPGAGLLRVDGRGGGVVEAGGEVGEDRQVGADAGGWFAQRAAAQHPTLQVGHRAVLLGPLGDRQHHVGQLGRLGAQEVGHHQQVQPAQPGLDPGRPGRGDHGIGAEDEQRAGAVGAAERVEQLVGRHAGAGQLGGVDAPHLGDVGAGRRVVDLAVAGELVGLLAVFAPALAVALAGEAAVPGVRAAGQAEGEGEVDVRAYRVDALGVLLGAPGGQDDRRTGGAERAGGRLQVGHRHPGEPFHLRRPVTGDGTTYRVETLGAGGDVLPVDQPLGERDVQQRVGDRQVGAGQRLQVQVGLAGGGGQPGVDHDQPAAPGLLVGQVPHQRRHGLGRVRADQQQGFRVAQVGQREGQPRSTPKARSPAAAAEDMHHLPL